MKRVTIVLSVFLTFLSARGVTVPTARAAESNVTGTWKWSKLLVDGKTFEWSMNLKQDGEKVTGTYSGGTNEMAIKEGKLVNGKLSIVVEAVINGKAYKTQFEGEVDGDTIRGTSESSRNGGPKRSSPWSAERSQDR